MKRKNAGKKTAPSYGIIDVIANLLYISAGKTMAKPNNFKYCGL